MSSQSSQTFQQFSLHPQVLAGVASVGFTKPTPIQQQAIPVAMQGRDLLGLAQTGTGKTAAFALPILHRLASAPSTKRGIRCLVIAPTRELAEQIHQHFVDLGKHLQIKSVAIYGGVSKGPQLAALRRGAQVVIACPGRLLDHVDQKDIDLSGVEVLVLDEADTMCDMGFLPDVRRILDHVPAKRQTLFFSATMPNEIRSLAVKILKDPELIQIGAIAPAKTVSHALYPVPDKLKKNLLLALLEQTPTGRALVFTRTKHRARTLALDLAKSSFRVAALQGNMSQNARQRAMDGFRAGKFDIMVATDIAAHGIDVPEISHVINFDFPNTADTYTHRIGRTGRADQTGEAFSLAGAEDGAMIREVEKEMGVRIERRRLPGFDYGDFIPEEQFREKRTEEGRGLRRATGPGNGGRSQPANGTHDSQDRPRGNGASDNGRRSGQTAGRASGANSPNGRPSGQPAGRASGATPSNGRRSEQPAGRASGANSPNGRRSEQPAGRASGANSPNGRRSEQPAGRASGANSPNGRRSGQSAGGASGAIFIGKRSERFTSGTSGADSSDRRTRSQKQRGTFSLLGSIRTGKPRGKPPARRR